MRAGTDASGAPAAAGPAWTAPSFPPCGKLPAASRPTTDSALLAQKRRHETKKERICLGLEYDMGSVIGSRDDRISDRM